MFTLHCTKKLLDRVRPDSVSPVAGGTVLGNWYATVLFWKPQVALLIAEETLLPVLMPLAPAATLGRRFPDQLALVLKEHRVPAAFIAQEIWQMASFAYAKTANRSAVGILNQFSFQAECWRARHGDDLLTISLKLAETPCGPLYKGHGSPDRALRALVGQSA